MDRTEVVSHFSLDDNTLDMLRRVHVNMPWKLLPRHLGSILKLRMNVEIGFEGNELDGVSRSEARAIAGRLREQGCRITLHGPFWDLAPGSRDPLIRRISSLRLHQFFDIATLFEPVQVVCHTGFDPGHHKWDTEFWIEQSVAIWEPLVDRAERMRVPLLLENVWEHDPMFHKSILDSIDSPFLGFCLDVGHQHSFSKTPMAGWLEGLSGRLEEMHLHDNDGESDSHLPIGDGSIDFVSLFEFLKARGIAPLLTLEPHREEHLARSLAGLRRVMSDD
jgi:sugar phosphate isomerase/epimerase